MPKFSLIDEVVGKMSFRALEMVSLRTILANFIIIDALVSK